MSNDRFSASGSPPLVLIVDDDAQFRRYLRTLLEREGFRICEAADGKQGWESYLRQHPQLIITDIVMPEQEGIELIITIKKQDPVTPIVAMSGGNAGFAENYLEIAHNLGASATLAKPFTADMLRKTIRQVMMGNESRPALHAG